MQTYSNDGRYSVNYEQPNNWKLQIKSAQIKDQGTYECQISTHPPQTIYAHLKILGKVKAEVNEMHIFPRSNKQMTFKLLGSKVYKAID